ncbi:Dehydrogenase/reductase SDR family member 7 [Armadillidium nasatum]|uniref:Dehydrogenase/reductase SDR family member 7 n=1 Tax=Armadillidium nasatum TaxID=96803 RepID=A0A5N5SL55_9CRUS|nr:Dehydrogenase/reductase SDR family member 7 [Armadillidium nasatum]
MSITSTLYNKLAPTSLKNGFFYINLFIGIYSYIFSHTSFSSFVMIIIAIIFIRRFVFIALDSDLILSYYEKYGKKVDELRGQVVWITGASSGIGEGLALELAKAKVKLALSAPTEDELKEVKQKCLETGKLSEEDVLVVPFDMTDYSKHEWAFSTVKEHFGKVDVLVSNAGRTQRARWENIELEVDKALFDLNVFSLINLARIVTRHFVSVGGGRHVITSSLSGVLGTPFLSSYVASKHALHGYFESLRAERGAQGISINILCPGPVESNIEASAFHENLDDKSVIERKPRIMKTARCARLYAIAMANDVKEML